MTAIVICGGVMSTIGQNARIQTFA